MASRAHGQGAENTPVIRPMANTCLISCASVGLISCANAGTCTATIAGSVHNLTVVTVRYQDKPRHTQLPRTRQSVSIESVSTAHAHTWTTDTILRPARRSPRPTLGWCAQTLFAHTDTPPAPGTGPIPPRRREPPTSWKPSGKTTAWRSRLILDSASRIAGTREGGEPGSQCVSRHADRSA